MAPTAFPEHEDPVAPIQVSLAHPEIFRLRRSCVGEWNRFTVEVAA